MLAYNLYRLRLLSAASPWSKHEYDILCMAIQLSHHHLPPYGSKHPHARRKRWLGVALFSIRTARTYEPKRAHPQSHATTVGHRHDRIILRILLYRPRTQT